MQTHTETHTHTLRNSCKDTHCLCTYTQHYRGLVGAEKSRGLMGSYGRWQSVLCTLWQMESGSFPSERLEAVFYFFLVFLFFFYYCLTDCFCLLPNIHCLPLFCSVSPQMTSHPWRATSFPFSRSFPPFFHPLCFLPSFCSVPFCYHDKQILNWHGVWLSPMEVHNFIIKSGEAHYKLRGTIMWQGIICPWHSRLILACVQIRIRAGKSERNEMHKDADCRHVVTH